MSDASSSGELGARARLEQRLASTIAELGAAVAARLDAEIAARTLQSELEKTAAVRADAEQTLARLRAELQRSDSQARDVARSFEQEAATHQEARAIAARREQAQARRIAALERELAHARSGGLKTGHAARPSEAAPTRDSQLEESSRAAERLPRQRARAQIAVAQRTRPATLRHGSERERELHRGPRSLAAVPSRPSRAAAQPPSRSSRGEQESAPRRRGTVAVQNRVTRAELALAGRRRESPDRSRSQARWLPSETMLGLILVVLGLTLAILILVGAG